MVVVAGLYKVTPSQPDAKAWGQPIPLRGVDIKARAVDVIAGVTVTQVFYNAESVPIDAIYAFPVDENASITRFEAIIEGRKIVGKINEKEQARQTFEKAKSEGKRAALLEQGDNAGRFTVEIGNIGPGVEVTIRFKYQAMLEYEGDEVRFLLPTTLAPRYVPAGEAEEGCFRPDYAAAVEVADEESEVVDSPTSILGLTMHLKFNMRSSVKGIRSSTHELNAAFKGSRAECKLKGGITHLDRDVVVLVAIERPNEPRALVEVMDKEDVAAMVTLCPKFRMGVEWEERGGIEFVFVVDRSGSMRGDKMEDCKEALHLFLRALPEDCTFNIVGFGSQMQTLFPEPKSYDDATLDEASKHVSAMLADLGGTELIRPLQCAYGLPLSPAGASFDPYRPGKQRGRALRGARPPPLNGRLVFVLTDGEVTNTMDVIKMVKENTSPSCRTFALGIGASVSRPLVDGMAKAGNGTAEFVLGGPGDRPQKKVMRQVGEALQPALTAVTVEWFENERKLSVRQSPEKVPPILSGRTFRVFGFINNGKIPTKVKVAAHAPDGPLTVTLPVDAKTGVFQGDTLHVLAAKRRIAELEKEGYAEADLKRPSWKPKPKTPVLAKGYREKIVRMALKYQLASCATSFVAVDEESPVAMQAAATRVVPSQQPPAERKEVARAAARQEREHRQAKEATRRRMDAAPGSWKSGTKGGYDGFKATPDVHVAQPKASKPQKDKKLSSSVSQPPPIFGGAPGGPCPPPPAEGAPPPSSPPSRPSAGCGNPPLSHSSRSVAPPPARSMPPSCGGGGFGGGGVDMLSLVPQQQEQQQLRGRQSSRGRGRGGGSAPSARGGSAPSARGGSAPSARGGSAPSARLAKRKKKKSSSMKEERKQKSVDTAELVSFEADRIPMAAQKEGMESIALVSKMEESKLSESESDGSDDEDFGEMEKKKEEEGSMKEVSEARMLRKSSMEDSLFNMEEASGESLAMEGMGAPLQPEGMFQFQEEEKEEEEEESSLPPPDPATMAQVITLQSSRGFLSSLSAFATAAGLDVSALTAPAGVAEDVWITALAVAWLCVVWPSREDEWEMSGKKAKRWLGKQLTEDGAVKSLLEQATALLVQIGVVEGIPEE